MRPLYCRWYIYSGQQQQLLYRLGRPSAHWAPAIWKLTLKVQHLQGSTLASKLELNHSSSIETRIDAIHNAQDISHDSLLGHQPASRPYPLSIVTFFFSFKKKKWFSNWKYAKCSSGVRQLVCRACTQWLIHVSPIKDKSHILCFPLKLGIYT